MLRLCQMVLEAVLRLGAIRLRGLGISTARREHGSVAGEEASQPISSDAVDAISLASWCMDVAIPVRRVHRPKAHSARRSASRWLEHLKSAIESVPLNAGNDFICRIPAISASVLCLAL